MRTAGSKSAPDSAHRAQFVRLRFKTLEIPPIRDGVAVGRKAALTAETMAKILDLVTSDRFEPLPIEDDTVGVLLVRDAVLRKLDAEAIRRFVMEKIKPCMAEDEVLALHLDIEIVLEQVF
jgi:hypothetical protein